MDSVGNCFWSYNEFQQNYGYIVEFIGCTGAPQQILQLHFAGGIAFDANNNMYYSDQWNGTVYKCAGETANCMPLQAGYVDPLFINLDKNWHNLYVSDTGSNQVCAIHVSSPAPQTCWAGSNPNDPPEGIAPGKFASRW